MGKNLASKWVDYHALPEIRRKADAAHKILKMWADWAKSTPMVRGFGRPSEENRTEIISDRMALDVEDTLSRIARCERAVIRDAYLKLIYPSKPEILDEALVRFYDHHNA
jgi:hypothetical protein